MYISICRMFVPVSRPEAFCSARAGVGKGSPCCHWLVAKLIIISRYWLLVRNALGGSVASCDCKRIAASGVQTCKLTIFWHVTLGQNCLPEPPLCLAKYRAGPERHGAVPEVKHRTPWPNFESCHALNKARPAILTCLRQGRGATHATQ